MSVTWNEPTQRTRTMSKNAPFANNYPVAANLFSVVAQLCKKGTETACAHRWGINCKSENNKKNRAYRAFPHVVQLVSPKFDPYP